MKIKVIVGKFIRTCPGKRHAWYESNVGQIRKPLSGDTPSPETKTQNTK